MAARTVHIVVEGRVQGVGFRAWLEREASRLHLTGWVRNRRTGAVECVAAGETDAVASLIDACRKGPAHARVDAVYLVSDVADTSLGDFTGFDVLPTV